MAAIGLQIGETKVFLRQSAYDFIENFRSKELEQCSTVIQSAARGMIARKRFARVHARVVALQALSRGYLARKDKAKQHESATAIQCMYRSKVARAEVASRKEEQMRELEEKMRKAKIAAEEEAAMERSLSAIRAAEAQEALDVEELKSQVEKLKTDLQSARALAKASKSRIVKLEAENKSLKEQLGSRAEPANIGHPPSHYSDQPDLLEICDCIGALSQQTKQGKKDLDALVKSLGTLQ